MNDKYLDAAALRGKTITAIERVAQLNGDCGGIKIATNDGKRYEMYHSPECCEQVGIYDVVGELQSLIGKPLVVASESTSKEWPDDVPAREYEESFTWTTYRFETETAKVCLRWLGTSNGYYSETVQIDEVES